MRFNSFAMSSMALLFQAAADPVCSYDMIMELSRQGLVDYAVINCLLATENLGKNECLTQFIQDHRESIHPIPLVGSCRYWIQSLVDSIHGASTTGCSYVKETDFLTIGGDCAAEIGVGLTDFQNNSGYSIMYPQCSSDRVRHNGLQLTYKNIVETYAKTNNRFATLTDLCDVCYINFQQYVVSGINGDDGLKEACEDSSSHACAQSTTMLAAKQIFVHCAGHDIEFVGPVCTAEQTDMVEAMIPGPYYAMTHCQYNPNDVFCGHISEYLSTVSTRTNDSCGLCYSEYAQHALVDGDDDIAACSGEEGVWSKACIAVQKEALLNFRVCAGVDLETVPRSTTSASPATTSRTATTTPRTTTSASTTTVNTTTKDASVLTSLLTITVVAAFAVAL